MTRVKAALAAAVILAAAAAIILIRDRTGTPKVPTPAKIPEAPTYARPLGVSVRFEATQEDPGYLNQILERFTSVTPENEMKWDTVQPTRGRFVFERADAIVAAARRAGRRVRGHTLTWDVQLPPWLTDSAYTAGEMEEILREHVRTVVRHFRGDVAQWDVVNEPLDDDGTLTPSAFAKPLGERFIDIAFDEAHRADPQAKLFLNEIASEFPSPKRTALRALAARLKRRGVPIDGIGIQGHSTTERPLTRKLWAADIRAFTKLGLKVELTEVDVGTDPEDPDDDEAQARGFAAAAGACRANPDCTGVTIWGANDAWSWLGADWRATPYDTDGDPKPAADALTEALG